MEPLRIALGAGANTRENPSVPLEQYQPTDMGGMGGIMDKKRPAAASKPATIPTAITTK